MRIVQVQHLYQLTFMPRLFPVNCYLVEEKEGLTLVDAGLPYSTRGIEQAAARIGQPIIRIVLTHAHGDHVGALDKLKARYPDAQVFISRRDAQLLQGDVSLEAGEPDTPIRGDVPKHILTQPDIFTGGWGSCRFAVGDQRTRTYAGFDGIFGYSYPSVNCRRRHSDPRRYSGIGKA